VCVFIHTQTLLPLQKARATARDLESVKIDLLCVKRDLVSVKTTARARERESERENTIILCVFS